jgi:bifunctional non-homologous end joining protein LigD
LDSGNNGLMSRSDPPEHLAPMLAVAGSLPADHAGHAFELKWDGIRAIAHWDGARLRLETRNLREVSPAYPELAALGEALGARRLVLDGEIVAFDDAGSPSFQRLQERMHTRDPHLARRGAARRPVTYLVFDLLHLDGSSLLDRPFVERRAALEELGLAGPAWATPPSFVGEGRATLAVARAKHLEGVIAKRLDSPYEPGRRSAAWIKHKLLRREEFVVGGWLPGRNGREGRIGSLLLGLPTADGHLRFVGAVGTGFTDAELGRLLAQLAPKRVAASPFVGPQPPRRDAVFVDPELVVEVAYTERTGEGILRHPSYKGTRIDKSPADVDTDAWVHEDGTP